MKSNWISNVQTPCGIGEVVSPREVTYSVTCQEWFVHGVRVRRILPTICVHMCRVIAVSFHSAKGRAAHELDPEFILRNALNASLHQYHQTASPFQRERVG